MAEAPRAGAAISSEGNGTYSRDQVTLAAINDGVTKYLAGTVIGQMNIGSTAVFANASTATGNGTSSAIVLSSGVKEGVYTFECIVAGATALFQAQDPAGNELATLKVGTAYASGGLGLTISAGGTNYVVGDQFTVTVGNAVFANAGGDTGNGTCGAITVLPGVIGGTYRFTAISATVFTGVDPQGTVLPNLTLGTAYNAGGLGFTVTAGGAAYVAGDTFTIVTATGSLKWKQVNATAIDGSQNALAFLIFPQDVSGAVDVNAAAIVRHCEAKASLLVWPTGSTDDQIRAWTAQLTAKGILSRTTLI